MVPGLRPRLREVLPVIARVSWRPVPGPMDPRDRYHYVIETSPRRVRAMFGGEYVVDSTRVQLLFETGKLPVYYFPMTDVRMDLLSDSGRQDPDEVKGQTVYFDVKVGGRDADDAAWSCPGIPDLGPDISDLIAFDWNKMDAWFEEDEEVFVHARDPYHRVDVVESSRHVSATRREQRGTRHRLYDPTGDNAGSGARQDRIRFR